MDQWVDINKESKVILITVIVYKLLVLFLGVLGWPYKDLIHLSQLVGTGLSGIFNGSS